EGPLRLAFPCVFVLQQEEFRGEGEVADEVALARGLARVLVEPAEGNELVLHGVSLLLSPTHPHRRLPQGGRRHAPGLAGLAVPEGQQNAVTLAGLYGFNLGRGAAVLAGPGLRFSLLLGRLLRLAEQLKRLLG